ncbi:MAG: DNA mismatch repair protein MutS [Pseudomonadota bacterium]
MAVGSGTITPMMAQYMELREEHPDALLFFRMGDFYELFFDDAVQAAAALDIALTKRGKHLGEDIPMCGVPVHSAEGYLLSLIRKGFRVAVCEQLEDPSEAKKRGSKSVVKRGVTRLITPGTLSEDSLLQARSDNYLAAFCTIRGSAALAWTDMSTGSFQVVSCPMTMLSPHLSRLAPKEVLISQSSTPEIEQIIEEAGCGVTHLAPTAFDSQSAEGKICSTFGVTALDAFGPLEREDIGALGAIVEYLSITQKGKLPFLQRPHKERATSLVQIDSATRKNLELIETLDGQRKGSLLSIIDRTVTGGGARLLANRLKTPLRDLETLNNRLDAVTWFGEKDKLRSQTREILAHVPDLARALGRVSLDRAGPRDLAAIRTALDAAEKMYGTLKSDAEADDITAALNQCTGHTKIIDMLHRAVRDDPPMLTRDGGFVATGYDVKLDELVALRDDTKSVIAKLQRAYIELTDIQSLKVKHNNVLGYFVETKANHADRLLNKPLSETFIHRQTTANTFRFTTVELSELETKIIKASSEALILEKFIFEALCSQIKRKAPEIHATANALAELDANSALADLAVTETWVRPELSIGAEFEITAGRHPVVEAAVRAQGAPYIPNNCDLSQEGGKSLWLLTGPNMAGKSTFLRQNAILAILAQMGSYVPAKSARIGLVSQIFSRVGASDDLARGRSTFMVEMVETAAILNQADDRALVILDEIGRGTSTFDGLSIAWATVEHLHTINNCRALFATHYHELTALSEKLERVQNATVQVKEWEGEIVFLHEVTKGSADRSYGIQVARLAGLPRAVTDRAQEVLSTLEEDARHGRPNGLVDELPLFSIEPQPLTTAPAKSPADDILDEINPDELTPKDALDLVYRLKG